MSLPVVLIFAPVFMSPGFWGWRSPSRKLVLVMRWGNLTARYAIRYAKPFTSFLALTGITTALNFIMTANGVPALYTTLAESFADATGFPLLSVIMIQVLGYSTPLLPYQASPIVVAMALGKVPARAGMLLCLALAAVTYLVLLPLDYARFRVLGKL